MATEFAWIERYFKNWPLFNDLPIAINNGDDCAAITLNTHQNLVFSIDTMVESVHFIKSAPAKAIGYRALACAVSDLAAMGAKPWFFTLAISFSEGETWLKEFSEGLKQAAKEFKINLVGGDTTSSKQTVITIQVNGVVDAPMTRSGAQVDDLIFVTGSLGDGAAALSFLEVDHPNKAQQELLNQYYYPQPQLSIGQKITSLANSCIDISDGLIADLGHILAASAKSAVINAGKIPLSAAILDLKDDALNCALTGGDDYQLCFTAPAKYRDKLLALNCFDIGRVTDQGQPLLVLDENNQAIAIKQTGFEHFL